MRRAGPGGPPRGTRSVATRCGTRWGHEIDRLRLRRSAEATVPRRGPPGPARRRESMVSNSGQSVKEPGGRSRSPGGDSSRRSRGARRARRRAPGRGGIEQGAVEPGRREERGVLRLGRLRQQQALLIRRAGQHEAAVGHPREAIAVDAAHVLAEQRAPAHVAEALGQRGALIAPAGSIRRPRELQCAGRPTSRTRCLGAQARRTSRDFPADSSRAAPSASRQSSPPNAGTAREETRMARPSDRERRRSSKSTCRARSGT